MGRGDCLVDRVHVGLECEIYWLRVPVGKRNVEGTHDEGGVAGQTDYFRRNRFVLVPEVASLAELNAMVDQWDQNDGGCRLRGRSRTTEPARAALAIVALDAVATLGGHRDGVIKRCEQRTCGGLFVNTSRARRRRWCSMATCGNKMKKANLKAARDGAEVGRVSGGPAPRA